MSSFETIRLLQESRSRVARLKELIPESSESIASSQVATNEDEEESAPSNSINDSLAISTEDPEIQEKLTKLHVAKQRLQKLKDLMKIVQESSADQLPQDLLQLTEEMATSNTEDESRSTISAANRTKSDKQIQIFNKTETFQSDDDEYQEKQLLKLQEKQDKLLQLKKVLEELKSSLSDSLNLPPTSSEDIIKSDKKNELALNSSNSALWGELRKRRELQEELKSKRKQLQELLKQEKAKEADSMTMEPLVNGVDEVMGYGNDGATTQATWGGSTPDVGDIYANVEDDLNDGILPVRGEDERSASSESNEIESDDEKERNAQGNHLAYYRNDNDYINNQENLNKKELLVVRQQYSSLQKQMDEMNNILRSLAAGAHISANSNEGMYIPDPSERPNFGAVGKEQNQVYMRQLEMSNALNQCLLQQMKQQQDIQEVQKQTNQLSWMVTDRHNKFSGQTVSKLYSDSSLTSASGNIDRSRSLQRKVKSKSHEDILRRIGSDRESGITSATDQSLFETLREPIYSEVATMISQNEDRPHFLIELFRELQKLTTDYLRQRAIFSLQDLTSRYLREDTISTKEPQHSRQAWMLSNATSEHTPSESIATIDDEEMQAQLGGRGHGSSRHAQDDDLSCLSYDYMEVVDSATSMATPPSNASPYDLPFASDSLGDTIIHLDKALKEVRAVDERARRGTFTIEPEASTEEAERASRTSSMDSSKRKHNAGLTNSSSAYDIDSGSSLSDVPYPRVNTQELDRRIHVILKELVPYIKEHSQQSCSSPILSAICTRVLSLAQNETKNEEFARFFHRQLNSTLIDSLGKYIGKSMKVVAQEILVDISEILFNELAFFELMQDVDSHEKQSSQEMPSYKQTGSSDQQYTSEEGNINSEIDSETETESADNKPVDSVHEREVKTAVDMLSKNNGDEGVDIEMEELGKDRDDAMANQFEERSVLMQETEFIDYTEESQQTDHYDEGKTENSVENAQFSLEGSATVNNEKVTESVNDCNDAETQQPPPVDTSQNTANSDTGDFENDELLIEHLPSKLDVITKNQLLQKMDDESLQNDPLLAVIDDSHDTGLAQTSENVDPATFAGKTPTP